MNCEDSWKEIWNFISTGAKSIIPRGLCIAKFPSVASDDTEFQKKWDAILNKCSLDLILLLIEQAKAERSSLTARLQEQRAALSNVSIDLKLPYEEKLKGDLGKLETTIKQMKLKKMKRYEDDYSRNEIYLWEKWRRTRSYYRNTSISRKSGVV